MATMMEETDSEKGPVEVGGREMGNTRDIDTKSLGDRPECFSNTFEEVLFTCVATLTVGTGSFLIGVVTVISTFIARDLDMTTAQISWIAAASGLTTGSFLLAFDLFGRKSILVGSLATFTILCLGAGFSQNGITLDILNGMLGLSSASAVPAAIGILGASYSTPSKRKNYAFACFSAGNPLGFVVGTLIGGIATQFASWRASYWVLSVMFLLATIFAAYCTPRDTSDKVTMSRQTVKRFDLIGILLCILGVATFSSALTEGSTATQGWTTPYVIVLLIIGAIAICGFIFWESRYTYALIPMSVWRDRNFSLLTAILALGFLGFPVAMFWTALYFQRVSRYSPIEVAVHMLPAAISGTLVNIVAGAILHKVSNKLLMAIGSCAYTIAFLLLALNKTTSSYWSFFFPALVIMVIGADFQFNVVNMYIMTSRPKSEQSTSGGILQTATRLCTTISFGIATAIFGAQEMSPTLGGYWDHDSADAYAAVFWYCTAVAGVSVLLVPFLTIGTQGNKEQPVEDKPRDDDCKDPLEQVEEVKI